MKRHALTLLAVSIFASSAMAQAPRTDLYVANGAVHAAVELGGILYIGGEFFEVGPSTGSAVPIDAASGLPQGLPKVVGKVFAVASDGAGGWFIGGEFTHVGGQARSNLAHVLADHSVAPWNPGTATVYALVVDGNTVYVGGSFLNLGGQTRNHIGAVDATTGLATSWNPNSIGEIRCLALSGGVGRRGTRRRTAS